LESVCTPKGYREFESHSLRQRIGAQRSWAFLFKTGICQALLGQIPVLNKKNRNCIA
jgi:hypothetical protein